MMGQLDKYKSYIYDVLSENAKSDIGLQIVGYLTANLTQIGAESPEDYISSLNEEDVSYVKDLVRSVISVDYTKKSGEYNISYLENIVAFVSLNSLWFRLRNEYPTEENIFEALKSKTNLPKSLWFTTTNSYNGDLEEYLSNYKKYGFEVLELSPTEMISNGCLAFTTLLKLYDIMSEKFILEEVVQAAENIIKAVDALYKNLFKGNYIGLLLPDGQVLYSSQIKKNMYSQFVQEKETYLQGIASSWYSLTGVNKISINMPSEGMRKETYVFDESFNLFPYDMFPYMHSQNLINSQNEYNAKKNKIREDIKVYLTRKKEEGQDYSESIKNLNRAFLSGLFLLDANQHTIQLRASLLDDVNIFEQSVISNLNNAISGAEKLKVLNNLIDGNVPSIQNITIIYSMSKFEQEVLFAHKLYHGSNATPPSITAPILGIKMDGTLFRKNLFGEKFTTILAGSRSGKGTLTQSLLAPLIASGQPIIYMDNKPDIASLFWDLEKKYKEHGKDVHFLAIDSLAQSSTFIKNELSAAERGRVFDENGNILNLSNIPSYCPINNDNLRLLRTFKVLQLLFLAGEIEANNKSNLPHLMNYVFIDEITDLSKRLYDLYLEISKIGVPKKGDIEGEAKYEWGKKVCSVINSVNNGFNSMRTMISNKHNFKFILIGQVFNKNVKWPGDRRRVNNTPGLDIGLYNEHFVYKSMSLCNRWLSGRQQVLPGDYVLHNDSEYEMAKKTGVFLYHEGKPNGPENLIGEQPPITDGVLFRSYFALVRNDIENSIQDIKSAIADNTIVEYFNDNQDVGYTNKFLYNRLSNYGMSDLNNSLAEMYDENMSQAIRGVGFGGLLEDIASLQNLDLYSDDIVAKLNAPYDRLMYVLRTAGILDERNYDCLESYLYDCDENSFYSSEDIKARFWRGFNNNGVYVPVAEVDSKIDYSKLDDDVMGQIDEISVQAEQEIQGRIEQGDSPTDIEEERLRILQQAEDKKEQVVLEMLIKELNALKSEYGVKISNAGKKLYTYKKDIQLFENAKQDVLGTRQIYEEDFEEKVIAKSPNETIRGQLENDVKTFLDKRFGSIESITFEIIQGGRQENKEDENSSYEQSYPQSPSSSYQQVENQPQRQPQSQPNYSPVERTESKPVSQFSGGRVQSILDTGDLTYNIHNLDDTGNIKASKQLTQMVVKDIKQQFGGINNIEDITINGSGCLIINGYGYMPKFSDTFIRSLGAAIQNDLLQGKIGRVVNLGAVVDAIMSNIYSLGIEDPKIAHSYLFQNELGIRNDNYEKLFRRCYNLSVIYLPDGELNRNNPVHKSSMSLSQKLANLFGFGRGDKKSDNYVPNPSPTYNGNSVVDRMFDSKPVRVLTGALGWTLGCKAVVLAATMFGPWGLLFGGLAMAGAYKEVKNDRNDRNYRNDRNNGGGYNRQGGGRQQGQSSGKKKKKSGGSGGFNQRYD